MIELLLLWSIPCVVLLTFQYLFGEKYLMNFKGKTKAGYVVVAFCELAVIMLGTYVMLSVEYMEVLGLAYLVLNAYLFYKFSKRHAGKKLV